MFEFWNLIVSHLPWFWLSVMVFCIIIEAATFSLTTVWAAVTALFMIFFCRTGLPLRWQLLIFFVISLLLLIFTRPFAVKKLKLGRVTTNVNTLEGQEVLVVKKITQFEKGEVKASNGVVWMATFDTTSTIGGSAEIAKNTVCEVVRVEGNTLVVKPRG